MQILKYELEDEYALIGIHTSEEDYRLVYLLNQNLNTRFIRYKESLDFENSNASFSVFEFKDRTSFINYYLISNKFVETMINPNPSGLFTDSFSSTSYLVPEKKKIDFFLKIEGCNKPESQKKLVDNINQIKQVITSYDLDPSSLKSKDNLIF